MKTNTKLVALVVSAAIAGSAVTIMATSAITGKGTMGDVYVPAQQNQEQSFVRTTAYPASIESDFTKAAESTINSVVSIKSYATPPIRIHATFATRNGTIHGNLTIYPRNQSTIC